MPRDVFSFLNQVAREIERDRKRRQREAEREQNRLYRERVRARKAREKAKKEASRSEAARKRQQAAVAKEMHTSARIAEVNALNAELAETYARLDGLLIATLDIDNYFDLESLRQIPEHPPFECAHLELPLDKPPLIRDPAKPAYEEPPVPKALFGRKKKHETAIASAKKEHARAIAEWHSEVEANSEKRKVSLEKYETAELQRRRELKREQARYSKECSARDQAVSAFNESLDTLITNLAYGAKDAVERYVSFVFSNSQYPDAFSVSHEAEFKSSTAELHLRVLIPQPSEVPTIKAYRYIKKHDDIKSSELSQKARKDRYASIVHQVALRSLHEVFEADRRAIIKSVCLEAGTIAVDPATGQIAFIPFVAVVAKRDAFLEFDLSGVVPENTLEHLGAAMSKNPYGLVAADSSGVRRV